MCGALPHCLRTGGKHHARRRHALRSPERPNQHGFARDAQRRRTRAGFAAPRACLAARNNATQSHKRRLFFRARLATIARNTADASALCGSSLCVRVGSLLPVVQWSASRVGNKVAYPTVVPYPSRPVSHPRLIYNRIGQMIILPCQRRAACRGKKFLAPRHFRRCRQFFPARSAFVAPIFVRLARLRCAPCVGLCARVDNVSGIAAGRVQCAAVAVAGIGGAGNKHKRRRLRAWKM